MSDTELVQTSEVQTLSDPAKGNGRRLTQREVAICLQLADAGKSTVEIAEVLHCHNTTVGRILAQWADDRHLARRYLEANTLRAAKTVLKSRDGNVALKLLGKMDIVREDAVNGGNNMVVVLGSNAETLLPPAINITPKSDT